MDDLPIHRCIWTAWDCFGYTVAGQLNLHDTDFGVILDGILSLSRETENVISDLNGLRNRTRNRRKEPYSSDEQPSCGYGTIHPLRLPTTSSCTRSLLIPGGLFVLPRIRLGSKTLMEGMGFTA
jgi:hypothetical protein